MSQFRASAQYNHRNRSLPIRLGTQDSGSSQRHKNIGGYSLLDSWRALRETGLAVSRRVLQF